MRKLKWFTLVEILIVIVIIGILIWALVPRMQSAQWRARDVARKNDLSQLQSAIVTSYTDRWDWPGKNSCSLSGNKWCGVMTIENELIAAWLNWVPSDPIKWNKVSFRTGSEINSWYWYAIVKKNWVEDAWFMLMAHTEVEWWSNWVDCGGSDEVANGRFPANTDLKNIVPCSRLTYSGTYCHVTTWWECYYKDTTELRYLVTY